MEVYDQTQTTITDQSVQILSMETTEMHSQNETNQEKKMLDKETSLGSLLALKLSFVPLLLIPFLSDNSTKVEVVKNFKNNKMTSSHKKMVATTRATLSTLTPRPANTGELSLAV